MNNQQKQTIGNTIIPKNLENLSQNSLNSLNNKLKVITNSGTLPEEGLSDFEIKFLLTYLSSLDTNNYQGKIGVGEREARVKSQLLKNRYYDLLHGMGRSGELTSLQPKAPGSSILQVATHRLVKNTLKKIGIGNVQKCLILPVATGMALTMCLLYLRQINPHKKKVLFLRIDQKSCFKSIITAGYEPIIIKTKLISEKKDQIYGLTTDLLELEDILKQNQQDVLAVMSNSSCFAPREPDDLVAVGKICRKYNVFHLVNNAYGLQSFKTIDNINQANSQKLIDLVVQSTDKNFLVPVGGSIIFSNDKKLIQGIDKNYPGRCSINQVLDLFISLTSLGSKTLLTLMKDRVQNFKFFQQQLIILANKLQEKLIINKKNDISMAITLKNLQHKSKELGSYLFNLNVFGARVVTRNEQLKEINGFNFENFGGHIDGEYDGFPYITVASAIGIERKEIEKFLQIFEKQYCKLLKKQLIIMNELSNIENQISELMKDFGKLVENIKQDPKSQQNEQETFALANKLQYIEKQINNSQILDLNTQQLEQENQNLLQELNQLKTEKQQYEKKFSKLQQVLSEEDQINQLYTYQMSQNFCAKQRIELITDVQQMEIIDKKNWNIVYPIYLNQEVARKIGRKVSKQNSCLNPNVQEIAQVLNFLNIPNAIEQQKRHPADFFTWGRVRYSLKDENGKLYNEEIQNRKQLVNKLGQLIPNLKSRNQKSKNQGRKR